MEALTTWGVALARTHCPAQLAPKRPDRTETLPTAPSCCGRLPAAAARALRRRLARTLGARDARRPGVFADRDGSGRRRLAWRQLPAHVGQMAPGLLDLQLPPDAPIVVLSDNGIDHLLLHGMHVGHAACSVSSADCHLAPRPRQGPRQGPRHPGRDAAGASVRVDARVYGAAIADCPLPMAIAPAFGGSAGSSARADTCVAG